VLGRTFDLIKAIQRRTSYLSLLLEHPAALTHLTRLAEASPWIASFLSRHPVLLDELLDPRTLYQPPLRAEIHNELKQKLEAVDPEDIEHQMEVLRVFKQVNVLRVAASDVTNVLPLMKVSDHLSDIAEVILEAVVTLCWQNLTKKHGTPKCDFDKQSCSRGFATIAYGKLGGLELGYGSDLDLVFLHAAEPGETGGTARSIDNTLFFSRLGQRVLHYLTTHTAAGILYEADMRLRPSGTSGMLVCHINGFRDYQVKDAWTWEHQALIRARAIIGDPAIKQFFENMRRDILTQPRDAQRLKQEVIAMRAKLRQAAAKTTNAAFDIKQGRGGMVDIEFLVQYLVLRHARQYPQIVRWTDNVRLLQALNEAGILDETTAFGLRRAYLLLRAAVHRLNLQGLATEIDDDRFDGVRHLVQSCWRRYLGEPEKILP
jgi:glutamate-ammonia-ligase adenylyltransferase